MADSPQYLDQSGQVKRPFDAIQHDDDSGNIPSERKDSDLSQKLPKKAKHIAECEEIDGNGDTTMSDIRGSHDFTDDHENIESETESERGNLDGNGDPLKNIDVDDLEILEDCRDDNDLSPSSDVQPLLDDDTFSELSNLSDSESEKKGWQPTMGPMRWVQREMRAGSDPRRLLGRFIPTDVSLPDDLDDFTLWKLLVNIISEPPRRRKLPDINTLEDVLQLLKESSRIIVLTGAGVSVSCGIPDFRSRDGVYARLAQEYPDLPDPQAMFDIQYFKRNPKPFFKFAKEIYPGQFKPSPSHQFIQLLEEHGKLLRNYTQNIDTLEQVSGIKNVLQCHGSFATATCMICKHKVEAEAIREEIMQQVIPRCPKCPADESFAILKPDIVFFGESLPEEFHHQMSIDKDNCDLLIVIGSSLKVRPVALIPNSIPPGIPQILINRESLRHLTFDVELLGDCDVITNELCHRLGEGWLKMCTSDEPSSQITLDELRHNASEEAKLCEQTLPEDISAQDTNITDTSDTANGTSGDTDTSENTNGTSGEPLSSHNINADETLNNASNESVTNKDREESSAKTTAVPSVHCEQQESANSDSGFSSLSVSISADDAKTSHTKFESQQSASSCTTPEHLDQSASCCTTPERLDQEEDIPANAATTNSSVQHSRHLTESQIEDLRKSWQPRYRNLASMLPDNSFLSLRSNRYVFKGAEVYEEDVYSDDDSISSSSSSNLSSDFDNEIRSTEKNNDVSIVSTEVDISGKGSDGVIVSNEENKKKGNDGDIVSNEENKEKGSDGDIVSNNENKEKGDIVPNRMHSTEKDNDGIISTEIHCLGTESDNVVKTCVDEGLNAEHADRSSNKGDVKVPPDSAMSQIVTESKVQEAD